MLIVCQQRFACCRMRTVYHPFVASECATNVMLPGPQPFFDLARQQGSKIRLRDRLQQPRMNQICLQHIFAVHLIFIVFVVIRVGVRFFLHIWIANHKMIHRGFFAEEILGKFRACLCRNHRAMDLPFSRIRQGPVHVSRQHQ